MLQERTVADIPLKHFDLLYYQADQFRRFHRICLLLRLIFSISACMRLLNASFVLTAQLRSELRIRIYNTLGGYIAINIYALITHLLVY
jgi:hypothetical protein